MKALVLYDATGRIWLISYGEETAPQGVPCMFVDIPDGAELQRIDVTDPDNPKAVFSYLPESDIGRLQKEVAQQQEDITNIQSRLAPEFDPETATLEEAQTYKQEQNKLALGAFLESHPLTWLDGEQYGVTQADQEEMALDLQAYQVMKQINPEWKLEWHNIHKACHEFTEENYYALLAAIINFVYPFRRLQETYKEQIYSAQTKEDVFAIELKYEIVVEGSLNSKDGTIQNAPGNFKTEVVQGQSEDDDEDAAE